MLAVWPEGKHPLSQAGIRMTMSPAPRSWPLPLSATRALKLNANFGMLVLQPLGSGEEARVEVFGRDAERLDLRVREEGNTVYVDAETRVGWEMWGGPWDLRLVLTLPIAVQADVRTHAGTLEVRGFAGCALHLTSNAGQIRLEDVQGRMTVSTNGGQIVGRRVGGTLDVQANAGQVDLEVVALDPGSHRVQADVGAIRLAIAQDLDVRVETRTVIGSVHAEFAGDRPANAVLQVSTTVGSIRVRPLARSQRSVD